MTKEGLGREMRMGRKREREEKMKKRGGEEHNRRNIIKQGIERERGERIKEEKERRWR